MADARPENTEKPLLSTVILTYKTKDLLRENLSQTERQCLEAGFPFRIVVVDNASCDGTEQMVKEQFPEVKLIVNRENLGTSRGWNMGIKASWDARYILLMNSDMKPLPGAIVTMLDYLEAHPDVDGVTSGLVDQRGRRQHVRTEISSLKLRNRDVSQQRPARFAGSGHLMAQQRTFADVGLFDEFYFFFNEDLDWSVRAVRLKKKLVHLPQAKILHFEHKGREQNHRRICSEVFRSNYYFYRKFLHSSLAEIFYWGIRIEIFLKLLFLRRRFKAADDEDERRQINDITGGVRSGLRLLTDYRTRVKNEVGIGKAAEK